MYKWVKLPTGGRQAEHREASLFHVILAGYLLNFTAFTL